MSDNPVDMSDGAMLGANKLLARAAAADVHARNSLAIAIEDFFLPEEARLDERSRAALATLLRALLETVESEVRQHAVRLLASRDEPALAHALDTEPTAVLARLARAGLLRDQALMAELVARVRQELLGGALPMTAPDDPERPSLINRFVQHPDRLVASTAMAVLIAESRRRALADNGTLQQTDLPAELHHKLVWWTSAVLRERMADIAAGPLVPLDKALQEAAQRSLAGHDEGERLEAAAMRLAVAIAPHPRELPGLLVEALGDRRIVLFTALLAHGSGLAYEQVREIVLEPGAERLWLLCRGLELTRDTVAQIGYALCEADPRRDLDVFADSLDAIAAILPAEARAALDPLKLDPDYRAALHALERSEGSR